MRGMVAIRSIGLVPFARQLEKTIIYGSMDIRLSIKIGTEVCMRESVWNGGGK